MEASFFCVVESINKVLNAKYCVFHRAREYKIISAYVILLDMQVLVCSVFAVYGNVSHNGSPWVKACNDIMVNKHLAILNSIYSITLFSFDRLYSVMKWAEYIA